MTPDEVFQELNAGNVALLPSSNPDLCNIFTEGQVLELMNKAALSGFKFGSNTALSMVKGALLVQLVKNREVWK